MTAITITNITDVDALVERILHPSRTTAIVCVSTPAESETPLLDVDALASEVKEAAEVVVVGRHKLNQHLTKALPRKLRVTDGHVRVWWPVGDREEIRMTTTNSS